MTVIIDEMDVEEAPAEYAQRDEYPQTKAKAVDERQIIEALVYQQWREARLIAD